MDFISLGEVIDNVAGYIILATLQKGVAEEAQKCSEAARVLYENFHNNGVALRWVEVHPDLGQLYENSADHGGMKILAHMAGWAKRELKRETEHLLWCLRAGLDPAVEPQTYPVNDGKYDYSNWFREEQKIGFNRNELIIFLDDHDIPHNLNTKGSVKGCTGSHMPKQTRQENAVLEWLAQNNYNPLSLPKNIVGTHGIKAKIRADLLQNRQLFTMSSFDKAWERLLSSGKMAYGKSIV